MSDSKDRLDKLKEDFDKYWNDIFGSETGKTNVEYFAKLSASKVLLLKNVLHNINNIITLELTLKFIDLLFNKIKLLKSEDEVIDAKSRINSLTANTNGYDVLIENKKIIAEVKCNIPVNKDKFGAAQEISIIKDINGLFDGKSKSKISSTDEYYKFMVILLCEDEGVDSKEAMKKIIDKYNKSKDADSNKPPYNIKSIYVNNCDDRIAKTNCQDDIIWVETDDKKKFPKINREGLPNNEVVEDSNIVSNTNRNVQRGRVVEYEEAKKLGDELNKSNVYVVYIKFDLK